MSDFTDASRPTLGVVAISFNEERDMPFFLQHLVKWADEIVIIDDGSTDRTARIARSYGSKVRFIVSPRKDGEYYSHQRNKGIAEASADWLLHMDIDERVTYELAKEIDQAILDSSKDGYRYRRLNFFLHRPMKGGGWQNWNKIHLARTNKMRFGGKMHEKCLVDAPQERIGQLKSYMWHLNDLDYVERVMKNITYSHVKAEDFEERGVKVKWHHFIFHPFLRFLTSYFVHKGFRDGTIGFLSAIQVFVGTFNWYAFAWDRQNRIAREQLERIIHTQWDKSQTFQEKM